jgi:glutaryl-CoA dehydrogenase
METRATPTGDGHRLSGHKRWATNSPIARLAVVWAQADPALGAKGVRGFVLPLPWDGVEVRPIERKLSLRISYSGEILLRDVELPAEAALPGANGLGAALACLNEARYSIVWGAVGAAEACLDAALARTKGRHQFGRRLAGFQLVQERLVQMLDDVTTSQLVARRIADLKAAGTLRHQQTSFGKRHNVAAAQRTAARARALLGAEGIVVDNHVMRHMANLESIATYEGTEEIHTLVLGADITGEQAFR